MKITEDVRRYATEHGNDRRTSAEAPDRRKAKKFAEEGAKILHESIKVAKRGRLETINVKH